MDSLNKRLKQLNKERDEAASQGNLKRVNEVNKQIKEVTKSLDSTRTTAAKVSNVLDNLSGASIKQIQQTIKAINKEMSSGNIQRGSEEWKFYEEQLQRCNKELKEIRSGFTEIGGGSRLKSIFDSTLGNFFGYLLHDAKDLAMEFIGSVKDMVNEGIELAKTAEGIEAAFDRINKPGLLDELRKATHGTVDDLELMKQAVKFKDFNLPVDQLGKYLVYAQQKAKDTGESIDFLVNSIVTGLGRQSPQILDNLGLSAKEISEEAKKSGDFFGAVATIIDKQMAAAGEHMETSMDRAAQAATRLKNTQLEVGKALLPLKENADAVFTEMKIGALQAVKWFYENRQAILEVATSVAALTMAYKSLYIWQKTVAAYHATMTALQNGLAAATGLLRSAVLSLKIAYANTTKTTIAFRRAIVAARAAAVVNPWVALVTVLTGVGVAVYAAIKAWDAHKKAIIENTVAFKTAKAVKEDFANIQKQSTSATLQDQRTDQDYP